MAEEIKINLLLEGIQEAISNVAKLGNTFSGSMGEITSTAEKASATVEQLSSAINKAAKAKDELSKETKTSQEPSTAQVTVKPSVEFNADDSLTVAGNFMKGFLSAFQDQIKPEDFQALADSIANNFSEPIKKAGEHSVKVDDSLSKLGSHGLEAFQKLGGATAHFAEALANVSASAAIEGLESLAHAGKAIAESFGEAGAMVGTAGIIITGILATIVGVDAAAYMLANHAAEATLEMDKLGRSAGTTGVEMKKMKEAFNELSGSGEQLSMLVRAINTRMLTGWPELKKEIRDSADTMSGAIDNVANAYDTLNSVKRNAELADERLRDAQRSSEDATRGIAAAKDNEKQAALSLQAALDGEISAQLRLDDAKRGVAAASREAEQAELDLTEALKTEKLSAFALRDAYNEVKDAKLAASNTDLSLKNAKLELDKLNYQKGLERGMPRDTMYEKILADREKKYREEAIKQRYEQAKQADDEAQQRVEKAEINASNAGDAQKRASLGVEAAKDRKAAADDGKIKAELALKEAERGVQEAALAVAAAGRAYEKAVSDVSAAIDKQTTQLSAVAEALQDLAAQERKVREAERNLNKAQNTTQDVKNADVNSVIMALQASPEERKSNDKLINLADVDERKIGEAMMYMASPDGGKTPPTAKDFIFQMSDQLYAARDDKELTNILRRDFAKLISPRADINAVLDALAAGREEITKLMDNVSAEELAPFDEKGKVNAKAFKKSNLAVANAAEAGMMTVGAAAQPNMTEQLNSVAGWLRNFDFQGFVDRMGEVTDALRDFAEALKGIKEFTDRWGITTPKAVDPTKMPMGDYKDQKDPRLPEKETESWGSWGLKRLVYHMSGGDMRDTAYRMQNPDLSPSFFQKMTMFPSGYISGAMNVPEQKAYQKPAPYNIETDPIVKLMSGIFGLKDYTAKEKPADDKQSEGAALKNEQAAATNTQAADKNSQAADVSSTSSAEMTTAVQNFSAGVETFRNMEVFSPTKKASGGYISGPGTSTSDSIPASLSNGEYVIKAAAVSHWGVRAMDAINGMRNPGFALGGLVGAIPSIGFASGGLAGKMDAYMLDIRTDAGSFPAMVNRDTFTALTKSAMGAKLKSSGVKPSWYK